MIASLSKEISNAIKLAQVQSAPENLDTEIDLINRLYRSRDAVHILQEKIELIDTNSKNLVASFTKY